MQSNYRRSNSGGRGGGGGGGRYKNNAGGGGYRSGGGGGGRFHNNNNHNAPWEEGMICSLKESFGFIYCADRPEEIFFHYSQLNRNDFPNSAGDLVLNQEVRFQVGQSKSDPQKLAAVNVSDRRRGSGGEDDQPIQWEIPVTSVQSVEEDGHNSNHNNNSNKTQQQPATTSGGGQDIPPVRVQGLVEKPSSSPPPTSDPRSNNNSNNRRPGVNHNMITDGSIRVLMREEATTTSNNNNDTNNDNETPETQPDEKASTAQTLSADGPLVRFTLDDYQPPSSTSGLNKGGPGGAGGPPRLFRDDLVEFEIVKDRRTGYHYARNIVLLQSEKERQRLENEQKLLQQATLEHGVITSLKGEYGFLKSNKRREEIFFHYSSIDTKSEDGDMVLQEGQDMQFLVVTEGGGHDDDQDGAGTDKEGSSSGLNGGDAANQQSFSSLKQPQLQRRVSARQVKMQPRGSVQFHDVVATCRTGVVLYPPQPHDSGHMLDQHGKVRLHKPVNVQDTESGEMKVIHELYLNIKDAPGGSFSFRGGTSVGMWVQAGDTLLFDVVQDFVDGSCHAGPTASLTPTDTEPKSLDTTPSNDGTETVEKAVRLIELAFPMRAEGIVNAVRDTYGFLHYAERPVDVHFKLFQVLPDPLQRDLRRNMGFDYDDKHKNRPLKLEVGTEVSFDLSVHGTIHNHHRNTTPPPPSSGGKQRGRGGTHNNDNSNNNQERENLKAQRILFLPPRTIVQNKVLGSGVEGVIAKQDAKQPYAGVVELATPVLPMTLEERHPQVAKMIHEYVVDDDDMPLIFHDVQTAKEDKVVFQFIEQYNNRINSSEDITEPKVLLSWRHTTQADADENESYRPVGKLVISKQKITAPKTGVEASTPERKHHPSGDENQDGVGDTSADEGATDNLVTPQSTGSKGKKSRNKQKQHSYEITSVKSVRYDKGSLSTELKKDAPPCVGDKVLVDVKQSRRTGVVSVLNIKITERTITETATATDTSDKQQTVQAPQQQPNEALGIVTDVVVQRKFGFISVIDDSASKRESLFFQFSAIEGGSKTLIRKGDEVKFRIGEKNGKRMALNVVILPRGTIPSKTDENACTGIVLLQPTHTHLKSSSSNVSSHHHKGATMHHAHSNASSQSNGSSRWDNSGDETSGNSKDEEPITELGCVLLTEDPTGMFTNSKQKSNKKNGSSASASSDDEAEDTKAPEARELPMTLHYKNGAIAVHGSGAAALRGGGLDESANHPRRGDLVTFVKVKKEGGGVRDMRVVRRGAATLLQGKLQKISMDPSPGTAEFVTFATAVQNGNQQQQEQQQQQQEMSYNISLAQFVGCLPSVLKEGESVEAVFYQGVPHGICRRADLYLGSSTLSAGAKNTHGAAVDNTKRERPKLNLTVKKDRGGTIMAQSMMAKGPEKASNGFAQGWTTRHSKLEKTAQ